ncbi:MAG TPA: hypothetical protein VJP39_05615 [Gaiellaceae bacterium]|nr:hypothetical protein [Gaiellaceae bacterium]
MDERRLPPSTQIGAASMAFIAIGVIYLAAYLPKRAPLWFAAVCLAIAAALVAVNLVLIWRTANFARWRFVQVMRWGLLGYLVVAGMLEYTFLYDHTRGAVLAIMTGMLILFMVNVPLLMAFTVARYERSSSRSTAA